MRIAILVVFIAVCLMAVPAAAGEEGPAIDPPHTSVTFRIKHIIAPVSGRFDAFEGDMVFDPDDLEHSRIELRIPVASIDTGVAARDEHLRSPDFFDAEKYPDIAFRSSEIVSDSGNKYVARGVLTIKGASRKADIPFRCLGVVRHPNPQQPCTDVQGVTADFSIDRLAFGVGDGKWFKMGMVGKTVDVHVAMEILSQAPDCPK